MESEHTSYKQQQNTRLPEVFPSWYSTTVRELLKTSATYNVDLRMLPDYGGAGINLKTTEDPEYSQCKDGLHVASAKSEKCRSKLSASCCALPFLPPNKIRSLHEPCLKKLKVEQNRQSSFVNKMFHLQKKMKSKQNVKLKNSVLDLYKKVEENDQELKISYKFPPCILEAVNLMPTSYVNHDRVSDGSWLYTGGNLSYLPTERGPVLLHAGGKRFNSLVITPVRSSENARHVFSAVLEDQQTLKLNGKSIYQVSGRSIENEGFCCVRQHKRCEVLSIKNFSETLNATVLDVFNSEEPLCCAQLSPYIPGEYAVITSSGCLILKHPDHKQPLWMNSELSKQKSHDGESWWWCDFGVQPRSLVVADRKVIRLFDARTMNSTPLTIFNAVDNRSLLFDEDVMIMQQHPREVHQHFVATSLHFFIIDKRVPSVPVLLWKHCLNTKPCYCSVESQVFHQSTDELIALLGSQEGAQTSVFHMKDSRVNTVQPQSLSPPWYLSQPEDMVKLLKVQGLCLNHTVQERLQAPLTGVCSIPHPDSSGFTAFQMTSFCDLFFQDFYADKPSEDKTFNVSAGCPLIPPSLVTDEYNWWLEAARVKSNGDIKKAKFLKRVDCTEEFMGKNLVHLYEA
ncbi:TATA box-binding protein-associated factor, RNA polymerase I, subunit C-like, partial [Limulus polyphemus]|uniref:TATA box-binding protein-associated factor, RNA polymerase I, subunit C-like n=1 Tax=Limulus polyphemus TaxID=6850 RepID=A0ABM1BUR7_LIMPO